MTAASDVRSFKSIVTLIVFILTNVVVVFPFSIPIPLPASWRRILRSGLVKVRILEPGEHTKLEDTAHSNKPPPTLSIPINFASAPVIAVLFLLACTAIGRKEVHDGILGSDGIVPISIMAFFLAIAYIAISLDHTGLIRWLAVWVLRKGGGNGRLLYLFLYGFYFALGTLFGNDPIILSGTPFIAYMTRASENIRNPRAWIFAQFACANVASAILVSSNPTNLVLSGAFSISYITYTANMIVPVVLTGLFLFPFLLYVVFPSEKLIPRAINLHVLETESKTSDTSGPEPNDTTIARTDTKLAPVHSISRPSDEELTWLLHPELDRPAAIFCLVLFVITLAVLLATNAAGLDVQVYEITVPAAFVMLCRDVIDDYFFSPQRRKGAVINDPEVGVKRVENGIGEKRLPQSSATADSYPSEKDHAAFEADDGGHDTVSRIKQGSGSTQRQDTIDTINSGASMAPLSTPLHDDPKEMPTESQTTQPSDTTTTIAHPHPNATDTPALPAKIIPSENSVTTKTKTKTRHGSLESSLRRALVVAETACPRAYSVIAQLPFPLLPFTFGMFILVQGLVTKGWVHIFANGWEGWVHASGTMGAVFGMGLVSVILCNFAGTNIGATIVLSRVLQEWLKGHNPSDRTKQAAIYAMALGVNYGAFSVVFSASLAGLLWRSILDRKGIYVRSLDFARYNLPIIAASMAVGCGVLAAQVYIVKDGRTATT